MIFIHRMEGIMDHVIEKESWAMDHLATTSGLHAQNLTGNDIILREIGAMDV